MLQNKKNYLSSVASLSEVESSAVDILTSASFLCASFEDADAVDIFSDVLGIPLSLHLAILK